MKHSLLLLACLMLALAQMPWAGYQLGVGNQSIQIAFLETLGHPQLFTRDPMVGQTLGSYPSYFFHICAALLAVTKMPLPAFYVLMHLLATAGVFVTMVFLSRSIFRDFRVALVAMLILLAGHHQALAGETLYSAGFTHTWAVFPLSLCALALFYRERYAAAFVLAGVIFNLHALEAGYLVLVMGFVALSRVRRIGFTRLAFFTALFALAAAPTLILMVRQPLHATAEWLRLVQVRSADHSFPGSWWAVGDPDIPRFGCIIGLGALAMGFPAPPMQRRKTLLLAAGIGLLFVIGTVFTEVWPVPLVIRAQLFRSSRLLLVLAVIVIAHGCVSAWRLPWRRPEMRWQSWLEFLSAALTALTLAVPALLILLPWTLALALLVALINARVTWHQALIGGLAIVVCLAAWQSIQFVIPGLPPSVSWQSFVDSLHGPSLMGWLLIAAAIALWWLASRSLRRPAGVVVAVAATVMVIWAGTTVIRALLREPAADQPWVEVQLWARDHTPVQSLFLTPSQQSGFRIYSQRAVVGEWRDGTQLYFNAAYGATWWQTMTALQPGIVADADGKSLLSRGGSIDRLEDAPLLELANKFHADYLVLRHNAPLAAAAPSAPPVQRDLEKVYDNGTWALYRPQIAVLSVGLHSDLPAEDLFLRQTALPNIEKYRKSDARVQVVDGEGRPLENTPFRVAQTSSSFGFGCSLPFFKSPVVDEGADYVPPPVTPDELRQFPEVFSYSVIPFSGQWRFLEPVAGKPDYADLDAYVEWCTQHGIRPEFHFVAGYSPSWFKLLSSADQSRALLAHARDLAQRYGSRIGDWQVIADKVGLERAPQLFAELRRALPDARLGMADTVFFWRMRPGVAGTSTNPPAIDDLRRLASQGVKVDFFGIEARQPTGLWASGRQIYAVLDAFAVENVPVRISEFGTPVGSPIEGDVRGGVGSGGSGGGVWTRELQAEYYERFVTICFSHPDVEAVNVMGIGPTTWLEGQGLLDEKFEPTPAFRTLQELITRRWRTQVAGTLGLDGSAAFRGFHGGYKLTITLPDGRSASAAFAIDPKQPNIFRYQWDAAAGTLKSVEGH